MFTFLGSTQPHSYPLDDIEGFYQLIAGSKKSDRPIDINAFDKVHLKCDCINGTIVNGIREPFLYSFAFSSASGHEVIKEPRIELFKKINKSVLSHLIISLEEHDYKPVDFNNETISFTCQITKIKEINEITITSKLNYSYRYNINYDIIHN